MLRSMTGYGRGETLIGGRKVVIEIRSVNHRFLDISLRMARVFLPLENEIKKIVAASTARGKVEVSVQFDSLENGNGHLSVNIAAADHVHGLLRQLQSEVNIPGEINIAALLAFKDVLFEKKEDDIDTKSYWEALKPSLEHALKDLLVMQEAEGTALCGDLRQRMNWIESQIAEIEIRAPEALLARQNNLKERVRVLCEGMELDESRLLQEIAFLSDKSDITEELVRLKSHVKQFCRWFDASNSVGRKFEFLLQEINREVNTIGSKASDSALSVKVVEIKNELEKIREQVQNVM